MEKFCSECNLVVAPFARQVKWLDKTYHEDCYRKFHRRQLETVKARSLVRRKENEPPEAA